MKNREVRVGIIGGTFDPVHFGHLRTMEEIREKFELSEVIFVPTNIPPHKKDRKVLSPSHRLNMLKLAIETNPFFSVNDYEIKKGGYSYSINTLRYFAKDGKKKLFFVLGMDSFMSIETWKDYNLLFSLSNFIVLTRPGYPDQLTPDNFPYSLKEYFEYNPEKKEFIHISGNMVIFFRATLLDISSSAIRDMIKNGKSVRYLMPKSVEDYIMKYNIYK